MAALQLTEEQLAKVSPDHPLVSVVDRISQIEQKMLANDPELPGHLKMIWKELQQYEELAHLLTPEQIGTLVRGIQKHTAISLVVEKKSSSRKSSKPSVDDLI